MLTVNEASKFLKVTSQAVRVAIRDGRLKSQKIMKRVMIDPSELRVYIHTRWQRGKQFNENELSPSMAANLLGVPLQRVYHLIRTNKLSYWRQATQIITIPKESVLKIAKVEQQRQKKKKQRKLTKKKMRLLLTHRT